MVAIKEEEFTVMIPEQRKEYLNHIQVLEKVKKLITLPSTELMTIKTIAEWFEVDEEVIHKVVQRNKMELESNGMKMTKYNEFKEILISDIMSNLKIARRGMYTFTKRALLNVAMLLRDSDIAKRVRTALLDQQDIITDEQKTVHLDKEKQLVLNVVYATNEIEKLNAIHELNEYKNSHIKVLKTVVEEQQPKADFYDDLVDDSDADLIVNTAKSLGIGEVKMFEFLRSTQILYKEGRYSIPRQNYLNQGYFVVTTGYRNLSGWHENTYTTKLTGRGQKFVHRLIKKYGGGEKINSLRKDEIQSYVNWMNEKLGIKGHS